MTDDSEEFETTLELVGFTLVAGAIVLFFVALISFIDPDPATTALIGLAALLVAVVVIIQDEKRRGELVEDVDGPHKIDEWERENL